MIKLVVFISLILNVLLIITIKRKKIKRFFYKKKINAVSVEKINPVFKARNILDNTKFPSEEHVAKMVLVYDQEYNVKGLVSDYETWILAIMSKISLNIFEFGTCSGKNSYIMALNSPSNASVKTITLNEEQASRINFTKGESKSAFSNIKNESSYNEFMFSGTNWENKIEFSYEDSMKGEVISDLKSCKLCTGNDTGFSHLATAYSKKNFVILGDCPPHTYSNLIIPIDKEDNLPRTSNSIKSISFEKVISIFNKYEN